MTDDITRSLAALRTVSAQLAGELETVFLNASTALFARLDDLRTMQTLLGRVSEASGQEGLKRLDEAARDVGALLEQVEAQFGMLDEAAEMLLGNAAEIRALIPAQVRRIRLARMIATNALVVSRAMNEGSLARFATEARTILDRIDRAVAELGEELAQGDRQLAHLAPEIRGMKRTAQDIGDVRREISALLRALRGNSLPLRAVEQVGEARQRLGSALQSAVTHLQCGDAARQRLEHVEAIAARGEAGPAGVRPAARALAQRQLHAAIDDLGMGIEAALPEFDRMGVQVENARVELAGIAEAPLARSLAGVAERARRLATGAEQLAAQRDRIAPDMAALSALYARSAASAAEISRLDERIQLLGINATLVSGRLGPDGGATLEVSEQLRDCTLEIAAGIAGIVRLALLQESSAAVFLSPDEQSGADISAVRAMESLAAELGAALDGMTDMVRADRDGPLRDSRAALVRLLSEARSALPPNTNNAFQGEISNEIASFLDAVEASYTMPAEREVHAGVFPSSSADFVSVAQEAEDIFF